MKTKEAMNNDKVFSPTPLFNHVVEVVSDSGEGAQKCGQSFASIAAKMGYGIWTVEIIPAEIQPPVRSLAGASGNRIRLAGSQVTNGGDEVDLIVALNEQVLLGRVDSGELKPGATILLESKWREDNDPGIATAYAEAYDRLVAEGFNLVEIPMERFCLEHTDNPWRGKNMFVLGMLCSIYTLDMEIARRQVEFTFAGKSKAIIDTNLALLDSGFTWARQNLDLCYTLTPMETAASLIVTNGNTAIGLGIMASGMEVATMYPITPATSASHFLSEVFEKVGGVVHQAEDEIAACNFAIGASYAGKCAVTITSGPGYSLKQEALGFASMAEIPLVVVNVQRGGPSTGQPTKTEQGDLLSVCFGSHGDAPKVVMTPYDIEDSFHTMITARKIAEAFNIVVVVLTDASLATAQQSYSRPVFSEDWMAPPIDQRPIPEGEKPYDWDAHTGIARRFIPGQPNGMHCLTGLSHDRNSDVVYDPRVNEEGLRHRSLKLAAFQKTLLPPTVHGPDKGDLLIVGWGSTRGAVEEAVDRLREEGHAVSSVHLRFIQPMAGGMKELMEGFEQVLVVENNWSDDIRNELMDEDNRRFSSLALLLRARYLVDVDCWTECRGQPLKPGAVTAAVRERMNRRGGVACSSL
jgi:2-oxoglutarate ferredoxin oxidoreductase subunit alpha